MPIDNMSSSIRPQYFVTREDGTITPLVAMDELPIYVAVRGVPRVLRAADTVGMTSLGTVQTRGQYYVVDGVQPDIVGEATDRFDPNSSLQVANPQTMVSAWHMTTKHEKRTNSKDKKSTNKHDESDNEKPQKIYCSYWVRKGECDFEQQGCRYKHIMPMDLETLNSIGLLDIPAWYRDRFSVSSLRPSRNHSRNGGYGQQSWRKPTRELPAWSPPKLIQSHGPTDLTVNTNVPQGNAAEQKLTMSAPEARNVAQHHTRNKRFDLLSSDPLSAYPALAPERSGSSDTTTSSSTKPAGLGGFDFERTPAGDYIYKYSSSPPGTSTSPPSLRASLSSSPASLRGDRRFSGAAFASPNLSLASAKLTKAIIGNDDEPLVALDHGLEYHRGLSDLLVGSLPENPDGTLAVA